MRDKAINTRSDINMAFGIVVVDESVRPTSLGGNNGPYRCRQCRRNLTGCETGGLSFRLAASHCFLSQ